jgi:hypothetical protein
LAAALEVSVTLPPLQKVVEPLAVTVGVASAACETANGTEVPLQPLAFVTDTV